MRKANMKLPFCWAVTYAYSRALFEYFVHECLPLGPPQTNNIRMRTCFMGTLCKSSTTRNDINNLSTAQVLPDRLAFTPQKIAVN